MSARSRKPAPARANGNRASRVVAGPTRDKHIEQLQILVEGGQELLNARVLICDKLEQDLAEANGEVRSLKHMLESAEGRAAQDAFDIRRLTRINASLAEIVGNQAACLTGIDRGRARENNRPMAAEANGEARPFSSAANGARHD